MRIVLPLAVLTAILIKLFDGGPVLFLLAVRAVRVVLTGF